MRAAILLALLPALTLAHPNFSHNHDDDIDVFDYERDEGEYDIGVISTNSSSLEERSPEGLDFFDVGIMLPRGDSFAERDQFEPRGAVEEWADFPIERDAISGEFAIPQSYEEAKRMLASGAELTKRKLLDLKVRLTWYSGADLKNPSCGDWRLGGKWSPTSSNMICALTASWTAKGGKPKCGSFLKLTTKNRKSIVVRVVDSCASSAMSEVNSCTRGLKVVDLTQAAFSKLAKLNKGIIDGVSISVIPPPKKWTKKVTRVYGPRHF